LNIKKVSDRTNMKRTVFVEDEDHQ